MTGGVPLAGVSVTLYVAGTGGLGSGATSLGSATTNSSGSWSISYTCSAISNGPYYLVATGGANSATGLMSVLGTCPQLPSTVNIDEVTTVASVFALAQYLDAPTATQIGAPAASSAGLMVAAAGVGGVANPVSGKVAGSYNTPSVLDTLSNLVAACVDSASGSTACGSLFAAATPPGGSAPTTTLQALLDIARNPSNSAATLYGLAPQNGPFQPVLTAAPANWRLGGTAGALVPSNAQFIAQNLNSSLLPSGTHGAVTGDFNNDGIQDIAFLADLSTNGQSSSVLFVELGLGGDTFGPPQVLTLPAYIGNNIALMAVGDFNGDGKLDLAIGNGNNSTISIFLGNGDGTFTPSTVITDIHALAGGLVAADFNKDGKLDLVVTGQASALFASGGFTYYAGDGAGGFASPVDFGFGSSNTLFGNGSPGVARVADVNRDGNPDLVMGDTRFRTEVLIVALGDGTGNFPQETAPAIAGGAEFGAVDLRVADLNGDGIPDIALTNGNDESLEILLGNGDGTFGNFTAYPVYGNAPQQLAVADLNGDGIPDVAVAGGGNNTLQIFDGQGNGSFAAEINLPGSPSFGGTQLQPTGMAVADFNNDGLPDLLCVQGGTYNFSFIELNRGSTYLPSLVPDFPVGTSPHAVVTADFNGDGKLDLAVVNNGAGTVSILLGNGATSVNDFTAGQTVTVGNAPVNAVVGDFNGDGKLDLAVANSGDNTVTVLLGNGDGTFKSAGTVSVGSAPAGLAVGDFNGDGKLDIAVADYDNDNHSGNGSMAILLGNGDGTFTPSIIDVGATGFYSVAVTDLNGDGIPDLVVGDAGNYEANFTMIGNGDGTFQAPAVINGSFGGAVQIADFNGDGIPDVAIHQGGVVAVWFGQGNGKVGNPAANNNPNTSFTLIGHDYNDQSLAVGDFNGDGLPDIAAMDDNGVEIALNNGKGGFAAPTLFSSGLGTNPFNTIAGLAVGDFNGDGRLDFAAGDPAMNLVTVNLQ